ncbi:MAG: DUF3488 and transglutaminase-like domain-containing protein [Micrococcales bacterium]|nr:DUF3488 and transglutaminase-like domain-containing protein [Micrococcales bacterium]
MTSHTAPAPAPASALGELSEFFADEPTRRTPVASAARWPWAWWSAGLLATDVIGMGYLIVPGAWLVGLWLLMALLAVVAAGLRYVTRQAGAWVQALLILVGTLLVTAGAVLWQAGGALLPSAEVMARVHVNFSAALSQLVAAVPPVVDSDTFAPLTTLALGALMSVVVTAALVWRAAAEMLVLTLAPWFVVFSMRVDGALLGPLLAAAVALAFAYWQGTTSARAPGVRRRQPASPGRAGGATLVVAGALLVAVMAAAVAPSLPSWGGGLAWLRSLSSGTGLGTRTGLSVGGPVDINRWLQSGSRTSVMQVSGSYAGPLQVATMTQFDGRTWQPSSRLGRALAVTAGETAWPDMASNSPVSSAYSTAANVTINLVNWQETNVPLASGPRSISFGNNTVMYFPDEDTAFIDQSDGSTQIDESVLVLDRSVLPSANAGPAQYSAELEVPPTSHQSDIAALAQQLAAGQPSDYDKLMAIQNYLVTGGFSYTLTPDLGTQSDDAVWDFLQRKTGYCVHFASAMVVLGRALGIPMRAAVGFLVPPGGVVTGSNAHMWPQAYFAGIGWVDFDPTPGSLTAVPPPSSSAATSSASQPTSTASRTPTSAPTGSATAVHPTVSAQPSGPGFVTRWGGWLLGALAVLVAGAAALWARAWYVGRCTPERAWAAVAKAGRRRVALPQSATPSEVEARLGPLLGDDARARLKTLVAEIERRRYQPPGTEATGLKPRQWHKLQVRLVSEVRSREA